MEIVNLTAPLHNFITQDVLKHFNILTPQNGQTHSNNSSPVAEELFKCDHFVGLAFRGLKRIFMADAINLFFY